VDIGPIGLAGPPAIHLFLSTLKSNCSAIQRRNRRVESYCQLVRPIARHYAARCSEPLDDLMQVGLMGLLRAAELYVDQLKTPFEAFARPHIRGAILHYLRDKIQPIRLPRQLRERLDQRKRLLADWSHCHGNPAPLPQIRAAMGLSPEQWQQLDCAQQICQVVPLSPVLEERLQAPEQQLVDPADAEAALAALAQLEPPLAEVVRRVVLGGWSYRRTAGALQVSPMTVQRRLHRGLAVLRQSLQAKGEAAAPGRHRVAPAANC
jgi:RNA polymerase sigma-B factor